MGRVSRSALQAPPCFHSNLNSEFNVRVLIVSDRMVGHAVLAVEATLASMFKHALDMATYPNRSRSELSTFGIWMGFLAIRYASQPISRFGVSGLLI